jgi:hypothetical protein
MSIDGDEPPPEYFSKERMQLCTDRYVLSVDHNSSF